MAPRTRAAHFGPELFTFLRALARHNEREWFQAHRETYLRDVRDPMLRFIEDLGPKLRKISRHLVVDPAPVGGSMFRIHRDIRFSKDKRPYKTAATARFQHVKGRTVHAPGYYVHLGVDGVYMGSGLWHPDTATASRIRASIDSRAAAWKRITHSPPFRDGTLVLSGESLKRPPRGFTADHPLVDDLKRKDFITMTELDETAACAPDFLDRYVELSRAAAPFVRFVAEAVGMEW